jgi:hypothetical protein
MKALLVLVLLIVVVVVVLLVLAAARRRATAGPWQLEERSEGGRVLVRAVRPGSAPLEVGAVPFGDEDFELRIEEVRAEGRHKLAALNSARR